MISILISGGQTIQTSLLDLEHDKWSEMATFGFGSKWINIPVDFQCFEVVLISLGFALKQIAIMDFPIHIHQKGGELTQLLTTTTRGPKP